MAEFYKLIHQRASVPIALSALENAVVLDVTEFIEQLEVIRSRNPFYLKKLLKALCDHSELLDGESSSGVKLINKGLELSEWVFEQYVELLSVPAPDPANFKDIIRYTLGPEVALEVEEQPFLLSASGTTGFRTWEAALFLGELIAQNASILGDLDPVSKVLELGAGTGLVSMAWAKVHGSHTSELYITDGDSRLIEQSAYPNFKLNGLKSSDKYKFQRLWWGEDTVPDVDVVLAADVTYDKTVVPSLVETLASALHNGAKLALIAATVRNEGTLAEFENQCERKGLETEIVGVKETDLAPIRIYRLSVLDIKTPPPLDNT
ncbi:LAFA_0A03950g1_1 [Lachancea sp. 'fantastica']|nr:LAFA_0A03950g1_1 [Lachancea sp. 'fantastica']